MKNGDYIQVSVTLNRYLESYIKALSILTDEVIRLGYEYPKPHYGVMDFEVHK